MLGNNVAYAVLPAEDIDRAKDFYTNKLGLKISSEQDGFALFEAGQGTSIMMYQRERTKAEHTTLGFNVDDLEATVKELSAKGVTFEQYDFPGLKTDEMGIAATGDGKSAWIVDPEGNIISIAQM